jgi:diaminohydroxyphosphoribosylaminopyrimidine deaminase/5-amino-6-(5-phosphoribosylamino)uracil reductase
MQDDDDRKFMLRCLELASMAEGLTYPNPLVGSVIVHGGTIIGEGCHQKAGGPHAEVVAVDSVKNRDLLASSTLYVNLEPCSHFGKTPPCADMIIARGIPRVVAGTTDTSEKVSGKGIARLRSAGINVTLGVCEEECRRMNRRFFAFHEKKRPYITLKWAQSADGFIDRERPYGTPPEPYWISGKPERVLVHRWRAAEQALLVGAGTVRADDPKLDVREWKGNNPVRIILSGSGILPENPALRESIGSNIVFTFSPEKISLPGAVVVKLNTREPAARQICDYLWLWGVQSLLIEGGASVINHFIRNGLWDEARIFYGKKSFTDGVRAPEITGTLLSKTDFSESCLSILLKNT